MFYTYVVVISQATQIYEDKISLYLNDYFENDWNKHALIKTK